MNISLTLCNKDIKYLGIPTYDFINTINSKKENEALDHLYTWLSGIDLASSVLVCVESLKGLPNEMLRNEQESILVSHSWDDITDFCEFKLSCNMRDDINFAVFEFDSYEDAFDYCKDLREGF